MTDDGMKLAITLVAVAAGGTGRACGKTRGKLRISELPHCEIEIDSQPQGTLMVCCPWSVVGGRLSVLCHPSSVIRCRWSVIRRL